MPPHTPWRSIRPASARGVALELVGRTDDGSTPGPLGLTVVGDYTYLAAWRRGLRVILDIVRQYCHEQLGIRLQFYSLIKEDVLAIKVGWYCLAHHQLTPGRILHA